MTPDTYITQMHELLDKIEELYTHQLKDQPTDALNLKPAPEKWCARECMDHLNRYDRHYLPKIAQAIKQYPSKNKDYKPGWLGKKFIKMMDPQDTKTMKALKNMTPEYAHLGPDTEAQYEHFLKETRALLNQLHKTHLNRRSIPTTMTSLIALKTGDAFHFLLMHKYRHTLQAARALPKSVLETS